MKKIIITIIIGFVLGMTPSVFAVTNPSTLIISAPLSNANWALNTNQTVSWSEINIPAKTSLTIYLKDKISGKLYSLATTTTSSKKTLSVTVPANTPNGVYQIYLLATVDGKSFSATSGSIITIGNTTVAKQTPETKAKILQLSNALEALKQLLSNFLKGRK